MKLSRWQTIVLNICKSPNQSEKIIGLNQSSLMGEARRAVARSYLDFFSLICPSIASEKSTASLLKGTFDLSQVILGIGLVPLANDYADSVQDAKRNLRDFK